MVEWLRRWIYPLLLGWLCLAWVIAMTVTNQWALFGDYWPMSITMVFGSFVAGATLQGGAAVAFPVFTKLLHIPTDDARTFGLMIQSVGMMMATVMILVQRVKILPHVIGWVALGSVFGSILGTYYLVIPTPYPRVLFTLIACVFGLALIVARWLLQWQSSKSLPNWGHGYRAFFFVMGIIGGIVAAHTGSGADTLTFIVLTLLFGIDVKVSTPTTVIIMGLNSLVGFWLHGVVAQDIGIVWNYWLVCVPVVATGAPLGALVAAGVKGDVIIVGVLILIALEMTTTLWLIPFTAEMRLIAAVAGFVCAVLFGAMLYWRQRREGRVY